MPNKYTYPDSEVLRNKHNLTDPAQAHIMETRLAFQRVAQLAADPVDGRFDLDHYLEINQRMFQDMGYGWAGKLRDVDTGTTNTGLVHCRPQFLQAESDRVFGAIRDDSLLRGMGKDQFCDRLAEHMGELTALHPALNGNTRSQRVFVNDLSHHAGYNIDWQAVNTDIDRFKTARLYAHAGQTGPLRAVLHDVVRSGAGPRELDGATLAGPAVDPLVQRAALAGVAHPLADRPAGFDDNGAVPPGTPGTQHRSRPVDRGHDGLE